MHPHTLTRRQFTREALASTALACLFVLVPQAGWAPQARAQSAPARGGGNPRTITWEELVPKDWDPMALFRDKPTALIREGSAAERELMKEMRDVWDKAPTRDDLKGQRVRLPGYVVPLDMLGDRLQDFLLVPYFGACIHSPPPPANQIVHVTASEPISEKMAQGAVFASGRMEVQSFASALGVSGYRMAQARVQVYQAPRKP